MLAIVAWCSLVTGVMTANAPADLKTAEETYAYQLRHQGSVDGYSNSVVALYGLIREDSPLWHDALAAHNSPGTIQCPTDRQS
jgi:hypothetical protein